MGKQDEVWQAYTEQGEPTATPLTREAAADGVLHGSSHVWIWRKQGEAAEILLQRRADDKRTWPGFYDVSAAGHIDFGETPLQAALRETKEELGLDIIADDTKLLFVHRRYIVSTTGSPIIENEFRWVYGLEVTGDPALQYADGEVDATCWVSLADYERLSQADSADMRLVPHGVAYGISVKENIMRLLTDEA
jgi:isopentenyl-diphosphate delta-isomerase